MVLQAMLESLEGLSEDIAKEYKKDETSGKFVLDVATVGGMELGDMEGLKSALGKERAKVKSTERKLKPFADIDPKKAREALGKVAEMASWDPDKEVAEKIEAREKQLIEKHGTEMEERDAKIGSITGALQRHLITNAAHTAIDKAEGSATLLLPHIEKQVRMREASEGQYIAEVIDKDGNPRIGDASGTPMTIDQLINEMRGKDEFAPAFKGTSSSGSGAGGGGAGGGGSPATPSVPGTVKTVSKNDQDGINANVEGIADGSVVVKD